MVGIYKIENLINGKVYIGQSIDIKARWKSHIKNAEDYKRSELLYLAMRKYGIENFSFEVIEECDIIDLDEREEYWIEYYHSCALDINSHGYNLTYGGQKSKRNVSLDEIEQMINLWNYGYTTTEISKKINRSSLCIERYLKNFTDYTPQKGIERGESRVQHGRKVKLYDKNGQFLKEYKSIKDAAIDLNCKIKTARDVVANPNRHFINKTFLVYAGENEYQSLQQRINAINITTQLHSTRIKKIDKDTNETIKTYNSIKEAVEELQLTNPKAKQPNISKCCLGERQTAYGYKWSYINDD